MLLSETLNQLQNQTLRIGLITEDGKEPKVEGYRRQAFRIADVNVYDKTISFNRVFSANKGLSLGTVSHYCFFKDPDDELPFLIIALPQALVIGPAEVILIGTVPNIDTARLREYPYK